MSAEPQDGYDDYEEAVKAAEQEERPVTFVVEEDGSIKMLFDGEDVGLLDLKADGNAIGQMLHRQTVERGKLEKENQKLRESLEDAWDEIAKIKSSLEVDPDRVSIKQMSGHQKDRHLMVNLVKKAKKNGGKAQMTYGEILGVFNHDISDSLPYKIADRVKKIQGFYKTKNANDEFVVQAVIENVGDRSILAEAGFEDD